MIMDVKHNIILFTFIIYLMVNNAHGDLNNQDNQTLQHDKKSIKNEQKPCPKKNMCRSKSGSCGYGPKYCDKDCQSGPCTHGNETTAHKAVDHKAADHKAADHKVVDHKAVDHKAVDHKAADHKAVNLKAVDHKGAAHKDDTHKGAAVHKGAADTKNIINAKNFECAFNDLDAGTRSQRLDGLDKSGYKPQNADEAAVFLAHVYHETGGLKTIIEGCAPKCGANYAASWCQPIVGAAGKLYYGRGWFQLTWPCNYKKAGDALKLDLLGNPDLVSQKQDVAVNTAVWFFRDQKMDIPARKGDFAATTKLINGKLECNGGSEAANQAQRVATYKRIRICFGLGAPKINPTC